MSPLAPFAGATTLAEQDPDKRAEHLLMLFTGYDRDRARQCWADHRSGSDYAAPCQEAGPFDCGLGLCPAHCKEVHVCPS